jgi:DNA topoisomerase-1
MAELLDDSSQADAKAVGLRYFGDDQPGLRRLRQGTGFRYVDAAGTPVRDAATLKRIRHLAIPPAWKSVWISPVANSHLQATGRDARGRKQYRYHADFRAAREQTKYEHLLAFGKALGAIRQRVAADMALPGLPRAKVLAAIVHLLDTTLIRVGGSEYARHNHSFGLTTLENRHVAISEGALRFEFKGKSGRLWQLKIRDRRVARIVKSCQELPGQHLFQYLDEDGKRQSIESADVNTYLREISGSDITAKDFRTFAGTVLAATALSAFPEVQSATEAKANVRAAIDAVAERLGNTPAICRKCYVHPEVLAAYLDGELALPSRKPSAGLEATERSALMFLQRRLREPTRPLSRRSAKLAVQLSAQATSSMS